MIRKNYIPTININPILKNNFNSKATLKITREIEKACVEVGFFQIVGHGIKLKKINKVCKIGENFFKSNKINKFKLAPKKWNKRSKNIYRGYFPNDVNGKEGLDLGDLKVTKDFSKKTRNQYIEHLSIERSFNKQSIEKLADYFENLFNLSETLFKSIIKIYKKDPNLSKKVFSRLKTLSTLRFNYYPNQSKPVEVSKQDGVALGCETQVVSKFKTEKQKNGMMFLSIKMPW